MSELRTVGGMGMKMGTVLLAVLLGPTQGAALQATSRVFFARQLPGDAGWSILSVAPDGSGERLEEGYAGGMGEYNPTVGPDGERLWFNTYRYGGWKIADRRLQGGGTERWTRGGDYYTNPAVSADGSSVVIEHSRRSGTTLEVRSMDGSTVLELEAETGGDERNPVWTPSGGIMFFGVEQGRQQIFVRDPRTNGVQNLSRSRGNDFAPAVSADGAVVAFYSDREGHADVWVMAADGSSRRNLTASLRGPDTAYEFGERTYWRLKLSWSPDGEALVFMSAVDGNYELFSVRPVDGAIVRLTETDASEITPFWARVEAGGPSDAPTSNKPLLLTPKK
jgi:Tol biopolymer transport system component